MIVDMCHSVHRMGIISVHQYGYVCIYLLMSTSVYLFMHPYVILGYAFGLWHACIYYNYLYMCIIMHNLLIGLYVVSSQF